MNSLTQAEIRWIADQIPAWPGGWTLEIVADPMELSAVLLPEGGDRCAATFLIDRVESGIRVMACRWDALNPVGVFPSLDAALAVIAQAAPLPKLQ
jgi:hypothetical protein